MTLESDERDNSGDALPPNENESKRQKSGSTTQISEANQRPLFPAGNDALMDILLGRQGCTNRSVSDCWMGCEPKGFWKHIFLGDVAIVREGRERGR